MTAEAGTASEIDRLAELLAGRRVVALAGAGISTESGIPDYRGPDGKHRGSKPMQYSEFARSAEGRARYWSRSAVGWRRVAGARPNPGHEALAVLEEEGSLEGIITQNVDGLHQAAGSRTVVELHGSLARVRCLGCGHAEDRGLYQDRLRSANRDWFAAQDRDRSATSGAAAPDGDVSLPASSSRGFVVPDCADCGGLIKPDVVFFGENVPAERVARAWQLFDECEALLVVGSSLTVFSGRRFVYRAVERELPIGIVNLGPTRADEVATVKIEGRLGEALPALTRALGARGAAGPNRDRAVG
jgi:NAD-dependent SIR2 family protein deacetylase